MSLARPARVAALAVLLGAAGCDYWNNLFQDPQESRADLEVKVVDAWTGESLADAQCKDSIRNQVLIPDGQGAFRLPGGATGHYAIRCNHDWYYDGAGDIDLIKSGTHGAVKLARRGLKDWYPDSSRKVRIPRLKDGFVRFPANLSWQATPGDDKGRFRYEWSFRHTPSLNHGHREVNEPLDSASFSPHFKCRAEDGVAARADTVDLRVFSLLNGEANAYLVGTDSLAFEWVRNRKPSISFTPGASSYKVGCGPQAVIVNLAGRDSDGECESIRLWAHSPSIEKDSQLTCDVKHHFQLPLTIPTVAGAPRGNNGSMEYENTVFVEITDDNGEKARDSITFLTYTNAPPRVEMYYTEPPHRAYYPSEGIGFMLKGTDTDGWITHLHAVFDPTGKLPPPAWWDSTATHPNDGPLDFQTQEDTLYYPFAIELPFADMYQVVATVEDDCKAGSDTTFFLPIERNHKPRIEIIVTDKNPVGGDSLFVKFNAAVNDPDTFGGQDQITSVHVTWGSFANEDTTVNQPSASLNFWRTLPVKPDGPPQTIKVIAKDSHGESAESSFQVP